MPGNAYRQSKRKRKTEESKPQQAVYPALEFLFPRVRALDLPLDLLLRVMYPQIARGALVGSLPYDILGGFLLAVLEVVINVLVRIPERYALLDQLERLVRREYPVRLLSHDCTAHNRCSDTLCHATHYKARHCCGCNPTPARLSSRPTDKP